MPIIGKGPQRGRSEMARWSVQQFGASPQSLIRHRLQYLGTVVADNKKDAIAAAIKQFQLEHTRRNEIVVTRIKGEEDRPVQDD
jgi:hypothetical protein